MAFPSIADQFPTCSLNCLQSSLTSRPDIVQNFKLLCVNVPIEKGLAKCVRTACSFADQQRVAGINSILCAHEPVQTKAPMAVVVFSILGFLAQGIISLRIYSRTKLGLALGLGLDDYAILMASVILFFVQILGIVVVFVLGFGRHNFNVNPENIAPGLLLYYLDEVLYQVVMPLVKVSILLFYLRLFPDPNFRKACYIMMVFAMTTSAAFMFVTIFQCSPIRGAWDKSLNAKCIDNNLATFVSSGFSIVTDFTILLMPIPRLIRLKVPRSKRNSVLILFSFGFIASAMSVIRLPFIVQFGRTDDPFYDNIVPGVWTFAEMAAAIIAACLPALKPLFQRWVPKLFNESSVSATEPVPWSEADLGPRLPNIAHGPLSRAFNSLFSRRENSDTDVERTRKFYEVKNGRIVQLRSRFSQISLGPFLEEERQETLVDREQEKGNVETVERTDSGGNKWEERDWREMLRENRWPLKPLEVYDQGLVSNVRRNADSSWV